MRILKGIVSAFVTLVVLVVSLFVAAVGALVMLGCFFRRRGATTARSPDNRNRTHGATNDGNVIEVAATEVATDAGAPLPQLRER